MVKTTKLKYTIYANWNKLTVEERNSAMNSWFKNDKQEGLLGFSYTSFHLWRSIPSGSEQSITLDAALKLVQLFKLKDVTQLLTKEEKGTIRQLSIDGNIDVMDTNNNILHSYKAKELQGLGS